MNTAFERELTRAKIMFALGIFFLLLGMIEYTVREYGIGTLCFVVAVLFTQFSRPPRADIEYKLRLSSGDKFTRWVGAWLSIIDQIWTIVTLGNGTLDLSLKWTLLRVLGRLKPNVTGSGSGD